MYVYIIYIYVNVNHQKRLKCILGNEASHLARPLSVPFWKLFHWSPYLPRPRKCLQLSESSGAEEASCKHLEKRSRTELCTSRKRNGIYPKKKKENIPKRKCIHPNKSVPFFPTRWRAQPCRRRSSSKSTCLASMGMSSPVSVSLQVWRPGPRFVQKLGGQRFRKICRKFAEGEGYTA